MPPRDISPLMAKLREVLLGRSHMNPHRLVYYKSVTTVCIVYLEIAVCPGLLRSSRIGSSP